MKNLKEVILEKLIINKNSKGRKYTCQPKDVYELRSIISERLKQDKNADLNDIDVSKVIDMYLEKDKMGLFEGLDPHNIHIESWDVSDVISMKAMFKDCKNFKAEVLKNWDIRNVKDMSEMFYGCGDYDPDILKEIGWDVEHVEKTDWMFNKFKMNHIKFA